MKPHDVFFYVLSACLLFAAYFRYSTHDVTDPYKCDALLTSGSWLDPPLAYNSKRPYQEWQPKGCKLRKYRSKDVSQCLESEGGRGAYFIGDSRTRQVFWAVAKKVDGEKAREQEKTVERHADIHFESGKIRLDFFWDPYLNTSILSQHLEPFVKPQDSTLQSDNTAVKPLLIVGGGLWYAVENKNAVSRFKNAVDKVVSAFPDPQALVEDFDVEGRARPVFMPVQPPYYDVLDDKHKPIQPSKVDPMNSYMKDLMTMYDLDVSTSFLAMLEGVTADAYEPRGLHAVNQIADRQSDIILNLRCNNRDRGYPYDGTCCLRYPVYWAQPLLIGIGAILFILAVWGELQEIAGMNTESFFDGIQKNLPVIRAILVIWAALFYSYVADRTQLFEKISKSYNNQDFFMFCVGIAIACFSTIRRSATPQRPGQEKPPNQDQPFMSRDQTDEWKGWMQLFILAYHYTGASSVLWIYKFIRLLVGSYLFMSGYGHAAYFYQKNDFSLKRVAAVLIRLNLLSLLLPWMMNADYMFYYFAPLVTYWYAVIYLVMFIKSDWNQQLPLFLTKVAVSCAFTTFLHTQPAIIAPLVAVVNTIFGSKWDAKEWFFRCGLDEFIVYIGMIVAVLYIRHSKPPPPPPPPDSISTTAHTRPGYAPHLQQSLYLFGAIATICLFLFATSFGDTKQSSNALHPYISPLPILAFVYLRNCTRGMRNHFSAAFAKIGTMSLETFILQYHIWLAADTKGLLSVGVFGDSGMSDGSGILLHGMGIGRWADCLLLGAVFIWISSHVSTATANITSAAIKALF